MESDDPQAVIQAWAKRMEMRHGTSKVWDQVLLQDLTWEEGLWRYGHDDESTLTPGVHLWTPDDLTLAEEWEAAKPIGNFLYGDWPRFLLTNAARQLRHCDPLDHEWSITIDNGEVEVECHDPCPEESIVPLWVKSNRDKRYHRISQYSYSWPCCHKYGENIREQTYATFVVKIQVDPDPWQDVERWPIYDAQPVFKPGSHVCSMCGVQVNPPRMARRRSDSAIICPLCGQVDARNTMFDPDTLEPTAEFREWLTETSTEEREDGTADSDVGGAASGIEAGEAAR